MDRYVSLLLKATWPYTTLTKCIKNERENNEYQKLLPDAIHFRYGIELRRLQ